MSNVIPFPIKSRKARTAQTRIPFSHRTLTAAIRTALTEFAARADGLPPLTLRPVFDAFDGTLLQVEADGYSLECDAILVVVKVARPRRRKAVAA